MVYIGNIESLTAELKVSSAKFDMEEKKAKLILSYVASIGRNSASREVPVEVSVDTSSIASVQEMLNEKRKKLEEVLNRIKEPIRSLLELSEYVEVDLEQIADQLLKEVENVTTEEDKK